MIQTRSETTRILAHTSIELAFDAARRDNTIWKISFDAKDKSRVRLVKEHLGTHKLSRALWIYEPIL